MEQLNTEFQIRGMQRIIFGDPNKERFNINSDKYTSSFLSFPYTLEEGGREGGRERVMSG